MKKLILPALLLLGIGGGAALGAFLKPEPEPVPVPVPVREVAVVSATDKDHEGRGHDDAAGEHVEQAGRSYVNVGKQTIVPLVEEGETKALMLFELAVDVPSERVEEVHELEPRLRDAFLRELFRMSHTGAFMTTFTDDRIIEELRRSLVLAARKYLGDDTDVLILDVMRQEL